MKFLRRSVAILTSMIFDFAQNYMHIPYFEKKISNPVHLCIEGVKFSQLTFHKFEMILTQCFLSILVGLQSLSKALRSLTRSVNFASCTICSFYSVT